MTGSDGERFWISTFPEADISYGNATIFKVPPPVKDVFTFHSTTTKSAVSCRQ